MDRGAGLSPPMSCVALLHYTASQGHLAAEGFGPGFVVGPWHWAPGALSERMGCLQLAPPSSLPFSFPVCIWCYPLTPARLTGKPVSPSVAPPPKQGPGAAHLPFHSTCLGPGAGPLSTVLQATSQPFWNLQSCLPFPSGLSCFAEPNPPATDARL